MTKSETAKIIDILQTVYPDHFKQLSKDGIITAVNVWSMIFTEDTLAEVQAAVMAHIATDTSRFMPTPGIIKQTISKNRDRNGLTEAEAWALVFKAIRNSAYHSNEEFNKLPATVQKIVGSPTQLYEWAITENLNTAVISSNFMRSYAARKKADMELQIIPEAVRKVLMAGPEESPQNRLGTGEAL